MEILKDIPRDFINFLLVTVFSLLIGLEQRRHHFKEKPESLYGTDRTYTMIGILGFILYVISPMNLLAFMAGGVSIMIILGIFYWKRIEERKQYGITSITIVFITYSLAPLLYSKPIWLTVMLVTIVLILTELKPQFRALSEMFDNDEFITLSKFLIIAGIILPLLPQKEISGIIPLSPFKIWLAVVVISGISYLSYLMQKFLFPKKGLIITGVLGGLYSSTATTVVLARKSKTPDAAVNQNSAAILMATGMMFIRVFVITVIFNLPLARQLLIPFSILTVVTFVVALLVYKYSSKGQDVKLDKEKHKNPLEFKTAILFAGLFVFFAVVTKYVLQYYGVNGLNILSVVVGVTDIDPFLLSLFTGKFPIDLTTIANATLIAVTSNNVIKLVYAVSLGSSKIRRPLILGFLVIIAFSIIFIIF